MNCQKMVLWFVLIPPVGLIPRGLPRPLPWEADNHNLYEQFALSSLLLISICQRRLLRKILLGYPVRLRRGRSLLFPVLANAGETYVPFKGEYRVAGPLAFGDIEEGTTHFYLHLTGDSAKALFQSIDVKAIDDECAGYGTKIKYIGEKQCSESANKNKYECYFSINLIDQKIERGVSC